MSVASSDQYINSVVAIALLLQFLQTFSANIRVHLFQPCTVYEKCISFQKSFRTSTSEAFKLL